MWWGDREERNGKVMILCSVGMGLLTTLFLQ